MTIKGQSWSIAAEQSAQQPSGALAWQPVSRPAQRVGGTAHIIPLRNNMGDKPGVQGVDQANRGSQGTSVGMPGAYSVLAGRAVER